MFDQELRLRFDGLLAFGIVNWMSDIYFAGFRPPLPLCEVIQVACNPVEFWRISTFFAIGSITLSVLGACRVLVHWDVCQIDRELLTTGEAELESWVSIEMKSRSCSPWFCFADWIDTWKVEAVRLADPLVYQKVSVSILIEKLAMNNLDRQRSFCFCSLGSYFLANNVVYRL